MTSVPPTAVDERRPVTAPPVPTPETVVPEPPTTTDETGDLPLASVQPARDLPAVPDVGEHPDGVEPQPEPPPWTPRTSSAERGAPSGTPGPGPASRTASVPVVSRALAPWVAPARSSGGARRPGAQATTPQPAVDRAAPQFGLGADGTVGGPVVARATTPVEDHRPVPAPAGPTADRTEPTTAQRAVTEPMVVPEVPLVSRAVHPTAPATPGPPTATVSDLPPPAFVAERSATPALPSGPATTRAARPTLMRVLDRTPVDRRGPAAARPGPRAVPVQRLAATPTPPSAGARAAAVPAPVGQAGPSATPVALATPEPPNDRAATVQLALAPPPVPPAPASAVTTRSAATASPATLDPTLYAVGLEVVGATVQRSDSDGGSPVPPPVTTSPGASGAAAPGGPGGNAPGAAPSTPEQVEELAGKLWPAVLRRIRHELVLDRERLGLRTDAW